jgi:hypothetical protein
MPAIADPFSPAALATRKKEYEWQLKQARSEQNFQRALAREDREWMDNLEQRKALRKRKEEEARIRALEEQQAEGSEEAWEQADALAADPDQAFANMWASLAQGAGGAGSYTEFLT